MSKGFLMTLTDDEVATIEKSIGYSFKDKRLLCKAFTHSSYVNENKGAVSNERLEFFGDRILNLICAEDLFFNHADNEGRLTEKLKNVVSAEPLKRSVEALGLNNYVKASAGFDINGTHSKAISDLFEALVAAIYVDSLDIKICKNFVLSHLKSVDIHDYISAFKEWCEKNKKMFKKYTEEVKKGNSLTYICKIIVENNEFIGKGRKIKDAEKVACQSACEFFKI